MPKESRQPCRYEYITRWFIMSLVLGEMRWCFSFRVASFSSELVLMMMRFLMREREVFVGVREREKREGDRCEG
jgi:hypothetical protein